MSLWNVKVACHVECEGPTRRVTLDLGVGPYQPADADEEAALALVASHGHASSTTGVPPEAPSGPVEAPQGLPTATSAQSA